MAATSILLSNEIKLRARQKNSSTSEHTKGQYLGANDSVDDLADWLLTSG